MRLCSFNQARRDHNRRHPFLRFLREVDSALATHDVIIIPKTVVFPHPSWSDSASSCLNQVPMSDHKHHKICHYVSQLIASKSITESHRLTSHPFIKHTCIFGFRHTCTYVYVHIYICICNCIYEYICISIYVYIYMYMYIEKYVYIYILYILCI